MINPQDFNLGFVHPIEDAIISRNDFSYGWNRRCPPSTEGEPTQSLRAFFNSPSFLFCGLWFVTLDVVFNLNKVMECQGGPADLAGHLKTLEDF